MAKGPGTRMKRVCRDGKESTNEVTGRAQEGLGRPGVFSGKKRSDKFMTQTVWQCEQLRAGQVYSKMVFNTREEAEQFVAKMSQVEPDIFWRLEPVEARMVWN